MKFVLVLLLLWFGCVLNKAGDFNFRLHLVDNDLAMGKNGLGDYGLTALVDIDHDGKLDFVLGGRQPAPSRLYWYQYVNAGQWIRHEVGTNTLSDVGLAALDVDQDGWVDLVCSGVWYRNTGKPRSEAFQRISFDENAAGAHDIVLADMDNDGELDVVMMGDERTKLNCICWYKIPKDPSKPWPRQYIGPSIHGAIAPAGVGDINGDGFPDVVRADTWFENKNGRGMEWVAHKNIPMGRKGPYGYCVRTAIVDIDGNGQKALVMCDADIADCKMVILRTNDKGESWIKQELPQSFSYGSLHALGVADFNGDGRLDIVSNEQEELLPEGRQNPRWILWENLGAGKFKEHILLDSKLGGHELCVGDVDGDGDVDIVSKPWGAAAWNGASGKIHVDYLENLQKK